MISRPGNTRPLPTKGKLKGMVTPEELFGKWYERGEVVFREGDPGDTMFVIQTGEVEVSHLEGGRNVVLGNLRRGEFFGEMCLLDNRPRSGTVTAVKRTRLLPISRRTLLDRAGDDPSVLVALLGTLSIRLKKAEDVLNRIVAEERELADTLAATLGGVPVPRVVEPTEDEAAGLDLLFAYDQESCQCFDPGTVIFREGDPANGMYFITEGSVEVTREHAGKKITLAVLGPHEFFGEMALITREPRAATVTALTPTRLLPVTREEFIAKINSRPDLGLFIAQVLVTRLRSVAAKTV